MNKTKLKIGIISHLVRDYNLGCSALAISNIALMDEVFKNAGVEVEYVVILPESKEEIDIQAFTSLEGITNNQYTYRTYPRLKAILKKPWLISKSKAFEGCDYIIDLCGGDGYTDNYGMIRLFAESVPVYMAKSKKIPILFAPQTIGPFKTKIGKKVAHHTLKKLQHLFVRDSSSFECCTKLKLKNITSQVIDVAFALPFKKQKVASDRIKVGINISGLLYNGGYNRNNYFGLSFSYKEFIDRLLALLTSDETYEVHLIPHVNSDTVEIDDDYRVCQKIAEENSKLILAPRFDSPVDAKCYISGMDIFSGARMHSTIGAISSGVPVIPVAYSRKFNGLYNTLEYPYLIDAKADITLEEAIKQFCNYINEREQMMEAVERAKTIYCKGLEKYKAEFAQCLDLY